MISFKSFLAEGGWGSTITQATVLTPAVAKKAVAVLPHFEKDFNAYLSKHHTPPIEVGKPVGSSAYIDRDLKSNPKKVYGDIDVLLKIPRIVGLPNSKNEALYRKHLEDFIKHHAPSYIHRDKNANGHHIIVKVNGEWVQVDMVTTFVDLADWTEYRTTPEHNLKGVFTGFLYSSLAEVLNLSIGMVGVQAKEIAGEIVPFKKIKVDRTHTITTDIGTFVLDIFKHYAERIGVQSPKVAPILSAHSGVKRDHVQLKDLIAATKGLAKSFELNSMYGKGPLKRISSYDDFMSKIKASYQEKADKTVAATKFDKAETPEAIQRAKDTKEMVTRKTKEILDLL